MSNTTSAISSYTAGRRRWLRHRGFHRIMPNIRNGRNKAPTVIPPKASCSQAACGPTCRNDEGAGRATWEPRDPEKRGRGRASDATTRHGRIEWVSGEHEVDEAD
jgi:hypothetical protein